MRQRLKVPGGRERSREIREYLVIFVFYINSLFLLIPRPFSGPFILSWSSVSTYINLLLPSSFFLLPSSFIQRQTI
jgi:hypothetical protein